MPTVFFFLAVQGDSIVVGSYRMGYLCTSVLHGRRQNGWIVAPSLLQAGDHIVLTRRENAGHVRALHLMDRWSPEWIFVPDGEVWCTREAAAVGGQ